MARRWILKIENDEEWKKPGEEMFPAWFSCLYLRVLQHRIINPLFFDQFVLAAGLDELALPHDVDGVGFADRVQPVGDDEARPPFHQPVECFLDGKFRDGVDAACRFVEQKQYRVRDERSCNGEQLFLPL